MKVCKVAARSIMTYTGETRTDTKEKLRLLRLVLSGTLGERKINLKIIEACSNINVVKWMKKKRKK